MNRTTAPAQLRRAVARIASGVLITAALIVLGTPVAAQAAPADPAAWPTSVTSGLSNAYGLDFSDDGTSLFVARRGTGLSRVVADGTVTTLVSSNDSFMAVAYDPVQDDLLVTVDSDSRIYRLDLTDMAAHPAAYVGNGAWRSRATTAHTMSSGAGPFVYGLEVGPDGAIYAWTYHSQSVLRIQGGVETAVVTGVPNHGTLDIADGYLYMLTDSGTRRAPLADLGAGAPAAFAGLTAISAPSWNGYGAAVLGDGRTYYQDGSGGVVQATLVLPVSAGVPAMGGRSGVGGVLSAEEGTWTAGTAFTYRWLDGGVPVAGATGRSYPLTTGDAGRHLAVEVTGTLSGYSATTATSPEVEVAAVPAAVGHPVAVAGTASVEVTWDAPTGGAVATGYTVTLTPGGQTCSTTVTRCLLGGEAGTTYTATVTPGAAGGTGPATSAAADRAVVAPAVPTSVPVATATLTTTRGDVAQVQPGETLEVVGTGFLPQSTVALLVYSTPTSLGTAVAGATGDVRAQVTVPSTLPAGAHSLVVAGVAADGSPRYLRLDVTVPGGSPVDPAVPVLALARTGVELGGLVPTAVVLLVAGAALVGVSRRRTVSGR